MAQINSKPIHPFYWFNALKTKKISLKERTTYAAIVFSKSFRTKAKQSQSYFNTSIIKHKVDFHQSALCSRFRFMLIIY